MKKIVLSTLIASSLLMAYNDDISDSESHTLIVNQTVVNDIITAPIATTTSDLDSNNGSVAGQYIYSDKVNIINIPLSYNINKNFTALMALPIVSTTEEIGIGDISLGGSFNFGQMNKGVGLNVTTLRYKTSTGDSKTGTGSGADAITLSHNINRAVGAGFIVNAIASYTSNFGEYTDEFDTTVSYGDAYLALISAAHPCLLSNKVITNVKLSYIHNNDHDFNYSFGSFNAGETTNIDLWLAWTSSKIITGIPLAAGIKIPLLSEVNSVDDEKVYQFYVSITGLY